MHKLIFESLLDAHQNIAQDKVLFFQPKRTAIFSYFFMKTYVVGTHLKHLCEVSEANWSGSALFVIMWVYVNNLDQVIWLAEN